MIGILDWGIGGFGFYTMLKSAMPDAATVYLSDNSSAPYGTLHRDALCKRVTGAVRVLAEHGVDRVVVACNAASTVVPLVQDRSDIDVVGIIDYGVQSVLESDAKRVGVIGGERTIRSGIYRRELQTHGVSVLQRIAQPLSGLIEAGEWRSEIFSEEATTIIYPLRNCEALLLACTHYPAAATQFRNILPDITLLDPAVPLLADALNSWNISRSSKPDIILTTGNPDSMRRGARLAFGVELGEIRTVKNG